MIGKSKCEGEKSRGKEREKRGNRKQRRKETRWGAALSYFRTS